MDDLIYENQICLDKIYDIVKNEYFDSQITTTKNGTTKIDVRVKNISIILDIREKFKFISLNWYLDIPTSLSNDFSPSYLANTLNLRAMTMARVYVGQKDTSYFNVDYYLGYDGGIKSSQLISTIKKFIDDCDYAEYMLLSNKIIEVAINK